MPNIHQVSVVELYNSARELSAVTHHVARLLREAANDIQPVSRSLLMVCAYACENAHGEVQHVVMNELDMVATGEA